jgi:hypothetical protein
VEQELWEQQVERRLNSVPVHERSLSSPFGVLLVHTVLISVPEKENVNTLSLADHMTEEAEEVTASLRDFRGKK